MSGPLAGKRVLLLQQRDWGLLAGHALARALHNQGAVLAAVTLKGTTDAFTRSQSEVPYEQVVAFDPVFDDPYHVEGIREINLERVCAALGIGSIWPIAGERAYVRSYAERYFYGYRQNRPDEDIAAYVKASFLTFQRLYDSFEPDIIVGVNFAATFQAVASLLAAQRGIPMIGIATSKVRDVQVFVHDYTYSSGPFIERVDALNTGVAQTGRREEARAYIAQMRERLERPAGERWESDVRPSLKERLKAQVRPWVHALRYYRNRQVNEAPHIGPTVDHRPPRIILRDHYAHRRNLRNAQRFPYDPLPEGPFVYMPLQFQPEQAIDMMAPYFNNQIETARLVAQSLPGDLTLVVKEHPAMLGRRQRSYYEKIQRSPNVKLVAPLTPSETLLRGGASAVAATGGTTAYEAAFHHVPVVQLGSLGFTTRLPNVALHTDLTTLTQRWQSLLATEQRGAEYERRLQNYVAGALDTGFPMDYLASKNKGAGLDAVAEAYVREVTRLLTPRVDGAGTASAPPQEHPPRG
jgi:hypothetical protein